MKLTKEYFEDWLGGLRQTWLDKDLNGLKKYFSRIENYYESPFKRPGKNLGDVVEFWKEIKNQEIIKLEMDCVAVDKNIGIAHWFFADNSGEYDGIYQVKFNDDLDCIEFRQWCVTK